MARTVRNPLELRTPVRTISSVMRNAPREKYRPNQVDFGRPEQGDQGFQNFQGIQNNLGNLTSVARPPRGTTGGNAPVASVQTSASKAPQANRTVTSTIKTPAAKTLTAAKPVAAKTTTFKPTAAKTTITAKAPVAAKTITTKAPVAAKTTTPVVPKTVTTTPVKTTANSTNPLTSVLKNAAVGAGAATLINSLVNKTPTPSSKPPSTPSIPSKPVGIPSTVTKPPVVPTSVVKPPVTPTKTTSSLPSTAVKAATGALTAKGLTGTTDKQLTDEQIQAELDRAKTEEGPIGLPEGAELQPDGTYTVTANGMVTTYDKNGNMLGAEADPSELTTWNDPDTGLTWNKGPDGEWTQEGLGSSDNLTTWNDPDTGLTWNLGADGQWTQEGFDSSSNAVTTWSDPDTGFTWNLGADGQWTQEGFDGTSGSNGVDNVVNVDNVNNVNNVDNVSNSGGNNNSDDSEAKRGGSIHFKNGAPRFATAGSVNPSAYSDTTEKVQPFQNVGFNYTENANGPITGSQSLYKGSAPYNPTYLSSPSSTASDIPEGQGTGLDFMPEGWPDGFTDNGDGTATRIEDNGGTTTIDSGSNIIFTTDASGNVSQPASTDPAVSNGPAISDNGNGTFSYYDGDQYVTADSETGAEISRTDSNGQIIGAGDLNTPAPVGSITSTGGGQDTGFAKLNAQNQGNQSDQNGVFNSLLNAVKNNPALAGGAVGALLSSFMDQSGGGSSTNTPVDISQLTKFDPRTTDFGAGMVGGRTGTGSPLVSYSDYAEGYGDETPDDRLYSDLGISGYLREPDMNNYRDKNGSLTDQSGNLVDEYGNLLDDNSNDETVETSEEPTMASGGTTHYTFGRVINPSDNLNINLKMGGLSQAYTAHSHQTNPVIDNRVDFRQGSAVNGAGDGQSDDIPAWLADGEYVMDAELVSMLGNGSNKAGAKILDKFREEVRSHKRSAPLGKIPPKAKSPLNYLKESLNG